MSSRKMFIIIIFIPLLLCMISCHSKETDIKDDYQYILNEEKRLATIQNIDFTVKGVSITYKIVQEDRIQFIVYYFENEVVISKNIYSFYISIQTFRDAISKYNSFLDGNYAEVDESILLIKTYYDKSRLDKSTYDELMKRICENYVVVYSSEELVF